MFLCYFFGFFCTTTKEEHFANYCSFFCARSCILIAEQSNKKKKKKGPKKEEQKAECTQARVKTHVLLYYFIYPSWRLKAYPPTSCHGSLRVCLYKSFWINSQLNSYVEAKRGKIWGEKNKDSKADKIRRCLTFIYGFRDASVASFSLQFLLHFFLPPPPLLLHRQDQLIFGHNE